MSVDNLYPKGEGGDFLKCEDLKGNRLSVEIEAIEVRDFFNKGEQQISISFKGKEKVLVLNKTNAKTIAKDYGDDETQWPGAKIIVFPTTCEYENKTVPCIRIMTDKPGSSEDIPF